jgi:hypothetical protein
LPTPSEQDQRGGFPDELAQRIGGASSSRTNNSLRGINMKRHDPARYDQAVREKGTREKQVVQITLPRGTKDKYDKAPTIQVDRNGASSTTTDPKVANRWGRRTNASFCARTSRAPGDRNRGT